ncbi:unnamed protein product [Notodromas monacha]|uniref:Uncharacterized protein n=1 Tax=Notodromas monacha TaxID=399045 RepID=A0A7R9BDZ6_9CRUS|nr:unnamed protein product [Notodromas monacha]CAG0912496.1 unnamed protein product [Notodromas monacha]
MRASKLDSFLLNLENWKIRAALSELEVLGKDPIVLPGDMASAEAENMAVIVRCMVEKGVYLNDDLEDGNS